jgi:hypothetical protein
VKLERILHLKINLNKIYSIFDLSAITQEHYSILTTLAKITDNQYQNLHIIVMRLKRTHIRIDNLGKLVSN